MFFPCYGIFLLSRAWPYMGIALTTTTTTTELGVQWVTQEGGERRGKEVSLLRHLCVGGVETLTAAAFGCGEIPPPSPPCFHVSREGGARAIDLTQRRLQRPSSALHDAATAPPSLPLHARSPP